MLKEFFVLLGAVAAFPAYGAKYQFKAGEGFADGCEAAGIRGEMHFSRNGRVGILKFPETEAAYVLFQQTEGDPTKWHVRNRNDRMDLDFTAASLAYTFDDGVNRFACQGRLGPG